MGVTSAMADAESCVWVSSYWYPKDPSVTGYWCKGSRSMWNGGYAAGVSNSDKKSLLTREWTSQQGLTKASGETQVNTKEIKCLDANPFVVPVVTPTTNYWGLPNNVAAVATYTAAVADNLLARAACMFYKVKKPAYPSTWPEDQKANFETLINTAWGGRRMRKSENAKLFENIRRIAAANVVEEWTARNAARQGQALREKVEGNVGQSLPVGTTNTTTNTAETPDL